MPCFPFRLTAGLKFSFVLQTHIFPRIGAVVVVAVVGSSFSLRYTQLWGVCLIWTPNKSRHKAFLPACKLLLRQNKLGIEDTFTAAIVVVDVVVVVVVFGLSTVHRKLKWKVTFLPCSWFSHRVTSFHLPSDFCDFSYFPTEG